MHIPCTYLDNISIFFNYFDIRMVSRLSNNRQSGFFADFSQYFQTLLTQPLETIRRSPRFVNSTAKYFCTVTSHDSRSIKCLFLAFDGTGTSHKNKPTTTNFSIADYYHGRLGMYLQTDEFVRFGHHDSFFNAIHRK